MASLRTRTRKDGTEYVQVLFKHNGKQCSASFETPKEAAYFQALIGTVGAKRALELAELERGQNTQTVAEWVKHHIEHLTGVQPATIVRYRSYLEHDIKPTLGDLPLDALSRDDCALWVQRMEASLPVGKKTKTSGKTVKNKFAFLSGCLNAAVIERHIPANPCAGVRLPEWHRKEQVYLSKQEFAKLLNEVTPYWRPLVEFLAASGCRWAEATALKPSHINLANGTVRIRDAWKKAEGTGYVLGPPKTRRSVRTIDVPLSVLEKLDLTGEWVFTNRVGSPVNIQGFHRRVWGPAVRRADLGKKPRIHDMRHTCVGWAMAGGATLPGIRDHLGHEDIRTTVNIYGHLDRASGQLIAATIADALS